MAASRRCCRRCWPTGGAPASTPGGWSSTRHSGVLRRHQARCTTCCTASPVTAGRWDGRARGSYERSSPATSTTCVARVGAGRHRPAARPADGGHGGGAPGGGRVRVVWRCHVGRDTSNELTDRGLGLPAAATSSRPTPSSSRAGRYAPSGGSAGPAARSSRRRSTRSQPKNRDARPAADVAGGAAHAGLVAEARRPRRAWPSSGATAPPGRCAATRDLVDARRHRCPRTARLVVQVSRWDRLKDMAGVLTRLRDQRWRGAARRRPPGAGRPGRVGGDRRPRGRRRAARSAATCGGAARAERSPGAPRLAADGRRRRERPPRQRPAAARHRRRAEEPRRGLRAHRHRGDVEGPARSSPPRSAASRTRSSTAGPGWLLADPDDLATPWARRWPPSWATRLADRLRSPPPGAPASTSSTSATGTSRRTSTSSPVCCPERRRRAHPRRRTQRDTERPTRAPTLAPTRTSLG